MRFDLNSLQKVAMLSAKSTPSSGLDSTQNPAVNRAECSSQLVKQRHDADCHQTSLHNNQQRWCRPEAADALSHQSHSEKNIAVKYGWLKGAYQRSTFDQWEARPRAGHNPLAHLS